jgi:hypothetical protein
MIYALTTADGRLFEFYVLSCAELYRSMYGGTVVSVAGDTIHETCSTVGDCDQLELL